MLMRTDPFGELDRLAERWFGRTAGPGMPMDAYREGDHFVVRFDLPGVDPSTIDVAVDRNVLSVSGSREWSPAEGQDVVVAERPQGSFRRQLYLGESLDTDRVEARYDAGVLTLTIPVAEAARPRKIEINAGGAKAINANSQAA